MKRSIFNQKGGVGKTSITCNLAAAFAKAGRRVLVVDLDSQANTSQYLLGAELDQITHTVADFFESTLSFKLFGDSMQNAVRKTAFDNLWVVPAERGLAELQPKLESRYKIFKLRDAINGLIASMEFDEILFDTPPALNFYSMSALMASDSVLIPFDCDAFSAEALLQVMEVIAEVASDHQPNLHAEGVIINHYQAQAKLPDEAIARLRQRGFPILKPYLSSSIVMRESHGVHMPLVYFKPKHKLANEYIELAARLMGPSLGNSILAPKDPALSKE
ncbi:MAG: ParA family protein [Proteobacteria bacterium]|nr:ParA family protein [Pseudomonadota bacterium]